MKKIRVTALFVSLALSGMILCAGGGQAQLLVPSYTVPNYAYSPPLRKFVDSLPGLNAAGANNLGQYIPVAVPDTITFPGSDYYEISLVEYTEHMHSDLPLPGTKLRGYAQTNMGTDALGANTVAPAPAHYLGPLIMATSGRAVRVKFTNKLPVGPLGNLNLPTDSTLMGAGMGPLGGMEMFTQNRSGIHLHGGFTPWISDGTPHQWITPAGETTSYPKGVAAQNVPDMWFDATGAIVPAGTAGATNDPGPGSLTYYYTNQQSARLLFYHDHAWGITRLNVYDGVAAGYIISDATEQGLVTSGVIPSVQVPLVIQDKTFVPAPATLALQDPLWDTVKWGGTGSLWFPHVFMPNQNADGSLNAMGRWDYAPGVWPTMPAVITPLPGVSFVPEAYMDTPVINGTAYPYMNVEPRRYRFRILNAANDRGFNLQLYYAQSMAAPDPVTHVIADPLSGEPDLAAPIPPAFIQIGNESGFLPAPVDLNNPPQQAVWDTDVTSPLMGTLKQYNLLMMPAERADIIVDFSNEAPGTNLILYNDAPAPMPAGDPRNDTYTGNPDMTAAGGAPSTLPGFGPNMRTLLQFRVIAPTGTLPADSATYPDHDTTLAALQTQLPTAFTASQPAPIVPAGVTANVTSTSLTVNGQVYPIDVKSVEMGADMYGRGTVLLGVMTYDPVLGGWQVTPHAYTDEPTEVYSPNTTKVWMVVNNCVDYHPLHFHLVDVQIINRMDWAGNILAPDPNEMGWKETLRQIPMTSTVVAFRPRVPALPFAVPNSIRPLDPMMPTTGPLGSVIDPILNPNPLYNFGWEYVFHCHILGHEEADMMRPVCMMVVPTTVTGVSVVIVGPTQTTLSWAANASAQNGFRVERATVTGGVIGAYTALGTVAAGVTTYNDLTVVAGTAYSYRVIAVGSAADSLPSTAIAANMTVPAAPSGLNVTAASVSANAPSVALKWVDNATDETGFTIQRAQDALFTLSATLINLPANTTTYTDTPLARKTTYYYRVLASNLVGASAYSPSASATTSAWLPAAPTNLAITASNARSVSMSWADNAPNETAYYVQTVGSLGLWVNIVRLPANSTTCMRQTAKGKTYSFRVYAYNLDGTSAYSNVLTVTTPLVKSAAATTQGLDKASPVSFPDSRFEAAVRDALNKPIGDILNTDCALLTDLDMSARGIANLAGIENFVNLTSLTVNYNVLTAMPDLTALTKLTVLNADGNMLTSMEGVALPTSLWELEVAGNQLTSLAGITAATSVGHLDVSDNPIGSLAGIGSLSKMQELEAANTQLTALGEILNLPDLKALALMRNNLTSLAGIQSLPLEALFVSDNQIADLSPIAGLSNLTLLRVDGNPSENIQSMLATWPDLQALGVSSNQVGDTTFLAGRESSLLYLVLRGGKFADLSAVTGMKHLISLRAEEAGITDITPLAELPRLSYVSLAGNNIADLSPLSASGKRYMNVLGSNVTRLPATMPVGSMVALNIAKNPLTGISGLATQVQFGGLDPEEDNIAENMLDMQTGCIAALPSMNVSGDALDAESETTELPNIEQQGVNVVTDGSCLGKAILSEGEGEGEGEFSGTLTVDIGPPLAVDDGSQWRIDGGTWQDAGAVLTGISVGQHQIEFKTLEPITSSGCGGKKTRSWLTPASQTVSVSPSHTTLVSAAYVALVKARGANVAGAGYQGDIMLLLSAVAFLIVPRTRKDLLK